MSDLFYPISVVAELLNIHPQTLRNYEVKGLIIPKRKGRARMYTDADVDDIGDDDKDDENTKWP